MTLRRADLGQHLRRPHPHGDVDQRHGRAGDPARRTRSSVGRRPARDLVPVRRQADGLFGQQRHHRHRLRKLGRRPHPRRAPPPPPARSAAAPRWA
jgi:hypothetical protein